MWVAASPENRNDVTPSISVFSPLARLTTTSFDRGRAAPGDGVLLYSDGVTEAHRPRRELFGERRLIDALRELSGAAPGAVVRRLTADLDAHAGHALGDDLCIVAARVGVAT